MMIITINQGVVKDYIKSGTVFSWGFSTESLRVFTFNCENLFSDFFTKVEIPN